MVLGLDSPHTSLHLTSPISLVSFLKKNNSVIFRFAAAGSPDWQDGLMVTGGGQEQEDGWTTEVYQGGSWKNGPDIPYPVKWHCQVLLDDTVYVIGGSRLEENADGYQSQASTLKSKKGTDWVYSANLSEARYDHACAVHKGMIFAIGGGGMGLWQNGNCCEGLYQNSVEIFDPSTESWTFGPELPKALSGAQAFSWGGYLWVFGGRTTTEYGNVVYRLEESGWTVYRNIDQQVDNFLSPPQIVTEDIVYC